MYKLVSNSFGEPLLDLTTAQSIGQSYHRYIESRPINLPTDILAKIRAKLEADSGLDPATKLVHLIELIYTEFTPNSEYTRRTDDRHYQLVYNNLMVVLEVPALNTSQTALGLAARGHDLERFLDHRGDGNPEGAYGVKKLDTLVPLSHPEYTVVVEELKKLDESLRKLVIHPIASLRLIDHLADMCGLNLQTRFRVTILIRFHDTPPKDITRDAIEAEFPGFPFDYDELHAEITTLAQADAMAFFQTETISLFLAERMKPNDSNEALVKRLVNNLKKMHPHTEAAFKWGQASILNAGRRGSNDSGLGDELLDEVSARAKELAALLIRAYDQANA